MSIDSINNYGAYGASNASGSTGSTAGKNNLTMNDFFKLMAAQLSNQDMYNTMDNTQFMAQMAQFSMVQALSDLSQLSMTSYSVGLIGKEVTLATANGNSLDTHKGIVKGVNLFNGSAEIIVDGKAYPLSSVMEVAEPNIIIPDANSLNEANLIKELSELVDEISEFNDAGITDPEDPNVPEDPADPGGTGGGGGETGGTGNDGGSGGTEGEGSV